MKTYITTLLLLITIISAGFSQSKKEIKKLKIKSSVVTVTETIDGKEKTFTESSQKWDKNSNVIEDIEYNKNGTFKKKESKKFNKNNDPTEEIIYDEKF